MSTPQTISQQEEQLKNENTIPFPIEKMDISWMTPAQKKFYAVLSKDENKGLKYEDISALAGYKTSGPWYRAIKDERFVKLLELIGVQPKLQNGHYPSHDEVEYIKNTKEREEYLKNDILDMRKLYLFPKLDSLLAASHVLAGIYHGANRLYKNPDTQEYCLIVRKSFHTPEEFNKVCNILSEYGNSGKYTPANEAYMQEHYTLIMKDEALQKLAEI